MECWSAGVLVFIWTRVDGLVDYWIDGLNAFQRACSLLHHSIVSLAPEVGIAPTSPRLQRGANLPQLLGVLAHGDDGLSRAVTLRGRSLIRRELCF